MLFDRCTHSQDLRLGPMSVDQDPGTQVMMKMMMRMKMTVMMLMALMQMARAIHAPTVAGCTGETAANSGLLVYSFYAV